MMMPLTLLATKGLATRGLATRTCLLSKIVLSKIVLATKGLATKGLATKGLATKGQLCPMPQAAAEDKGVLQHKGGGRQRRLQPLPHAPGTKTKVAEHRLHRSLTVLGHCRQKQHRRQHLLAWQLL